MVKGTSKRVVVLKSPDLEVFEEAIFIVREDYFKREGITSDDLVKQAQRVVKNYTRSLPGAKRFITRLPAPAIVVAGATATGVLLIATRLAGI